MQVYLDDITNNQITCSASNGYCTLNVACSQYNTLQDYTFGFNFTTAANNYTLRVPIGTFAVQNTATGKCDFMVT